MLKYCTVCKADTEHRKGNYRSKEIDGKYFHLESSFEDAQKNLSDGYIKGCLTDGYKIYRGDIPNALIEAYREHIKIRRKLKNEKHS